MLFLEGGDYSAIIYFIALIMVGPPILLALIGLAVKNLNKKASKVFYILAVVYLIIGLGMCGSLLING